MLTLKYCYDILTKLIRETHLRGELRSSKRLKRKIFSKKIKKVVDIGSDI